MQTMWIQFYLQISILLIYIAKVVDANITYLTISAIGFGDYINVVINVIASENHDVDM